MIYEVEERKQFSYRLRQAMIRSGMQSRDLAKAIEMDRHHLSHILCGRRTPHVITIQRILIALPDVDARWLIVGEQKPELEISLAPREWNFLQNKEEEVLQPKTKCRQPR